MNNNTLGKTIKAMYKLSGKTLPQLSDETGLSVDTINNLFYARIQKPGLAGVDALVRAMGFSIVQLMGFMNENPEPEDSCDVTELFTRYISSADCTVPFADTAKDAAEPAKPGVSPEIELLNAEHEKQLDRFRATHQRYVAQLQEQHEKQLEQMRESSLRMEQQYDKSLRLLSESRALETERLERENARQRRISRILSLAVGVETLLIMLSLILDTINRSIGWLR